jgi:hypothetical protein
MESFYSMKMQVDSGKTLKLTDKELRLKTIISLDEELGEYLLMNIKTILSKYRPILKKYVQKYKITGADEKKYEYRPTMLSYDLYGTIELAPLILEMNQMTSATQFCNLKDGVYLFKNGIKEILYEIMIMEERDLKRNETELKSDLATI